MKIKGGNRSMSPKMAETICIDLDGVIQDYKSCCEPCDYSKYPNLEYIRRDKCPVNPNAREVLLKLHRKYRIVIYTARVENERRVTEDWLKKHGIPYDELIMGKPQAFVYIDDFALTFTDWKILESIIELERVERTKINE